MVGAQGKVLSFEPNLFNRERFALHLEKNSNLAARLELLALALSDSDGTASFSFSKDIDGSSSSGSHLSSALPPLPKAAYDSFSEVAVQTARLDTLWKEKNLGGASLVKIDVEGAEFMVLKGGQQYFSMYKPLIFIEIHNVTAMLDVVRFLLKIGYDVSVLDESNATTSKCFVVANSVAS